MAEPDARPDIALPGSIAWLDVSGDTTDSWAGRVRTGPLALQIAPLAGSRAPYFFNGARLRGTRCVWSAATVSGAELSRRARTSPSHDGSVQVLVRAECAGSVFDPAGPLSRATMRVLDPNQEIREQFLGTTHLFTLDVQRGVIGVETATLAEMLGQSYDLSAFQAQLLRSAVGLLLAGGDELSTSTGLVGVDRYLGAYAGLLLRTAVRRPGTDLELMESIRSRTDTIIFEQAADAQLSPATIAAQLSISLRQLYRAFSGTESPAARIRRRRLEHAAELLAARTAPAHVDRIAQECGFVSAEYFSRAFRREFGLSPRAYRSAHRERPAAARAPTSEH